MQRKVDFQKRHFQFIADTIKETKPPHLGQTGPELTQALIQWERMVANFATNLRSTNPNFDRDRFIQACGVDQFRD